MAASAPIPSARAYVHIERAAALRRSSVGPRAERLFMAMSFACAATALAYVAFRLAEWAFFPEANPVMVLWSDRSSFAWRGVLSAYVGGMSAFAGYALARRAPEACARWLVRLVIAAASAIAAQGALLP